MTPVTTPSTPVAKLPVIILLVLAWALGGLTALTLQSGAAARLPDSQIESPVSPGGMLNERLADPDVAAPSGEKFADGGSSAGLVMPGALLLGPGVGRVWR